ncbi:sodium/proton antiporter, CPA1 family [Rhizobiales bacterium GAS191]|nr:sodium/proton antiporter, CPA1 family [Rhizobiales bacterium GAS113]SEC65800.1 sodium/proton antiporter, CPA1 family [Rhizobiales bacterium GAS191]
MLDIVLVLAVFAILLVVVALSQPLAVRLKLSPVVLLAVIGVAIGSVSAMLLRTPLSTEFGPVAKLFADLPVGSETFIYVFLPLLVFEAAITSDVRRIIEDWAPILMLAVVATLVTTAVVGVALWPLAGVPLVVCLLLGSVVATTDPAAVIAVFRDVGAPARLTRLVEGEALLNDAVAIVLFAVLLGMIVSGREPDIGGGALEFVGAFLGGAALGVVAGRAFLQVIPWTRGDRLAEATLTVALAYLAFIAAERLGHVSGVVAVLSAGMTVSAFGRARITPYNWSFLTDLWAQIAFWAHSLVFLLASILVPKLLLDVQFRDLVLVVVLIAAAFAARLLVLFLLLPLLSLARLTQPISTSYKLTIAWGGLRGALTLVLALAVTENPALHTDVQRFVAVLATGLVLFTLLVNGTTLRLIIHLFGLDQLSPVDQVLRDRVLALSYAEMGETIRNLGEEHELSPSAVQSALEPYEAWIGAAGARGDAERVLTDRERLAIGLVALGNQERMLVLETLAQRAASPATVQALLRNAEALIEGARSGGRLGYKRAAEAALAFPLAFRAAYALYRRCGILRFFADRLGDRFEMLLVMRLLIQELAGANAARSRSLFGERVTSLIAEMLRQRLDKTTTALDALRRQYPDYAAALEARFLRQSALRREMGRYQALFEEGLIASEVYQDLKGSVADAQTELARPRFDLGLDTRHLIARLDLFSSLSDTQLERVQKLLRPRFTVPNERVVRKGERGDAVFFIASGAAEVVLPDRRIPLGSGDVFGEMALLSGMPRQADVVALTYCRLLMLRKADFDRFMRDNRDVRFEINRIAEARSSMNKPGVATLAP